MAARFITIMKTSSTRMAAAVRSWKARSEAFSQMKTCTGSTVAAEVKLSGGAGTKETMPIISSGAVSPSAWASDRMVPVSMPGMASGRTWWNTVWVREAPTASAASRIEGGTAFSAERVAMMMVGRAISASTNPPSRGEERGTALDAEEQIARALKQAAEEAAAAQEQAVATAVAEVNAAAAVREEAILAGKAELETRNQSLVDELWERKRKDDEAEAARAEAAEAARLAEERAKRSILRRPQLLRRSQTTALPSSSAASSAVAGSVSSPVRRPLE